MQSVHRPEFHFNGDLILRSLSTVPGSTAQITDAASIEIATGTVELANLQGSPLTTLALDNSGKQILFTAGTRKLELWIAENILPGK